MKENSIIIDSEDKMLIIEYLYTVENYSTFNVKVKSGEFSGSTHFCISIESLVKIEQILSEMYNQLKGLCEISDLDSDSAIIIEMDKHGHMYVSGQIGGSHEEHFMKFKYIADQTDLYSLVALFQAMKKEIN